MIILAFGFDYNGTNVSIKKILTIIKGRNNCEFN